MGDLAECKACCNGVLLPFGSPQGFTVYFCTSCRRRFSGYSAEPTFEGSPVFSSIAEYSDEPGAVRVPPLPESELMERYRELLDSNPPSEGCWDDQSSSPLPEELAGFA